MGRESTDAAEELLAINHERYRSFVANSTEAIWCIEMEEGVPIDLPEMEQVDLLYQHARIVEANETFAVAYATTREDVLGWRLETFFPRSLPTSVPFLLETIRSGYRMTDEETVERAADGTERIFLNNFVGTIQDGKVLRVWGTARDVTDLRRTQEQIRLKSAAIEALYSGCVITDARVEGMYISYVNESFTRLTGYEASEVLGQNSRFLQGPDTDPETLAAIRATIAHGETFQDEILNYRKDGTPFWNLLRISPIRSADGTVTHYVGIQTDVTERKRKNEELRHLRDELTHVGRQATLGELTAAIAHELNQPLAAIGSNARAAQRFLESGETDLGEIGEILGDIVADNRRAAEVIRRLRALLQKHEPQLEPLEMNEVIRQVLPLLRSDALLKGVDLELELDEGLPPVCGDRVQLQQVLLNLILNGFDAMADLPAEERRLVLRTENEPGEGVGVSVRDFGAGFGGQEPERLFEPFHTTKADGMGMGLAIVRSILEVHQGRIRAYENDDRGATFHFTLPADSSVGR